MVSFSSSRRQQGWSSLFTLAALFSLATSTIAANSPRHPAVHKELLHRRTANALTERTVNSRARSCKKAINTSTTNSTTTPPANTGNTTTNGGSCFPSLGYTPGADDYKSASTDNWWCDSNTEAGFFGFTYGLDGCPSLSALRTDFSNMRKLYSARYVRIYSECPNEPSDMWDNILQAAYETGMGVMATMWFGFDPNSDPFQDRWNHITAAVKSNPLAPYVIRTIDVGSEPLFDQVPGDASQLISYIKKMKAIASPLGIQVGFSDFQYEYADNASILDEVDYAHTHELAFFSNTATTGSAAWSYIQPHLQWFAKNAPGKKVTITETGWPIGKHDFTANSASAQATLSAATGFVNLLNERCADMRSIAGSGGVGWFWSTWSENTLTGWGLMSDSGKPIFDFQPKVDCS